MRLRSGVITGRPIGPIELVDLTNVQVAANDQYTADDYETIDEIYNDILHHYVESTSQDTDDNNNNTQTSSDPELPANVEMMDIWVPLGRQLEYIGSVGEDGGYILHRFVFHETPHTDITDLIGVNNDTLDTDTEPDLVDATRFET
jgi:hypothetical protein